MGESRASFQGWVWNEETPTHSLHTLHHHFLLLLWCLSLPLFLLQKWIPALLTPGFLEEITGESASHGSSAVSLFLAPWRTKISSIKPRFIFPHVQSNHLQSTHTHTHPHTHTHTKHAKGAFSESFQPLNKFLAVSFSLLSLTLQSCLSLSTSPGLSIRLSHSGTVALSYKRGAEPALAEGSVLLHSLQVRLERGHPFRKKERREEGGGKKW